MTYMKPLTFFYMRKDQRRCVREDPLGVDQRDVCYEYEKVLCGGQEALFFLMVLS